MATDTFTITGVVFFPSHDDVSAIMLTGLPLFTQMTIINLVDKGVEEQASGKLDKGAISGRIFVKHSEFIQIKTALQNFTSGQRATLTIVDDNSGNPVLVNAVSCSALFAAAA